MLKRTTLVERAPILEPHYILTLHYYNSFSKNIEKEQIIHQYNKKLERFVRLLTTIKESEFINPTVLDGETFNGALKDGIIGEVEHKFIMRILNSWDNDSVDDMFLRELESTIIQKLASEPAYYNYYTLLYRDDHGSTFKVEVV